jgi:hypothetical protein
MVFPAGDNLVGVDKEDKSKILPEKKSALMKKEPA